MKKHLLLVLVFAIFMIGNANSQDVITGFSFSVDGDFTADSGLDGNLGYDVRAENAAAATTRTLTSTTGATDLAATADSWDAGMDDKFWSLKFKADGYHSFKLSSKQYSDETGPKEFKIQYKIGSSGTWTDITGGTVTVGTDWTTGVVTELSLPVEADNPGTYSIYLRWIMTSNTDVSNGTVEAAGISKIDDIIITGTTYPEPTTIIGFDFTDNTDVEFNADSGVDANLGYDVRAENGAAATTRTLTYAAEASGYSASVDGWDLGMDDKFWSIKFKADGFSSMTVSSKQYSDGAGPKDFKIQYKIGSSGTWTDVVDGGITVATDWSTGVVEELSLPVEMEGNGTTSMFIRWIMTSNTSVSSLDVEAMAFSRIDDIVVAGIQPSGFVSEIYNSEIMLYPNPCSDYFTIETSNDVNNVEIYNIQGALVFSHNTSFTGTLNVSTQNLSKGMYFVKLYSEDTEAPVARRIIVE
jgi:hypothetical protein